MGTITRDPRMTNANGKPAYVICYKDISGRRKKQRTDACTLEAARGILRKIESDRDKAKGFGLASTDQLHGITFAKFVEEEFLPACRTELRAATVSRYTVCFNQVKDTFGNLNLREINAGHIDRYKVARMKDKKLKKHVPPCKAKVWGKCECQLVAATSGTVNRDVGFIGAVLNRAVPTYIDRNPLAGIKRLKFREDNIRERTMTRFEEVRITEALDKPEHQWMKVIFHVGRQTLMRLGEILRLMREDIQETPKGAFIRVSKESKAHKVRMVPIGKGLKEMLDAIPVRTYVKDKQLAVSPYLFTGSGFGTPLTVDFVSHQFRLLFESVGASGLWFHDLRRTGASQLGAAGVPDRVMMKMGGWSTPGIVNRYAHMKDEDLRRASDLLANAAISDTNGEQVAKAE
jgi:integrase